MYPAPRLLPALAALAGTAALLAGSSAGLAQAAPQSARPAGPHSAVTWNGWRGVHFGDTTRSAHRRLGGSYYRGSDAPGGCGDIVDTRTGTVDAKVGPHAHRVSDIDVNASVSYPLGIHSTMRSVDIHRRLEAHGYTVRTRTTDDTGGDYVDESISVGPHGHTLYFLSDTDSGRVYRMGLALNRAVARELLEINGC